MITRQQADQIVATYLDEHEVAAVDFDSPLPHHDARRVQKLVVIRVDEHDFGWVYFYDGSLHVETGDVKYAVFGAAPLIALSGGHGSPERALPRRVPPRTTHRCLMSRARA
jgi:hypothetical protein